MMEEKLLNALYWIITILNKQKIPYHISGGFAAHIYGATRKINDIDIDIPEECFEKIHEEVKDFIIYGPEQYKNKKWDIKLITLNYYGQEIDMGGITLKFTMI